MGKSKKKLAQHDAYEMRKKGIKIIIQKVGETFKRSSPEEIEGMIAYAAEHPEEFGKWYDKYVARRGRLATPAMPEEDATLLQNVKRLLAVQSPQIMLLLNQQRVDDEVRSNERRRAREAANVQREQELVASQELPDLGSFLETLPVMEEEAPPPTDDDCPFDC